MTTNQTPQDANEATIGAVASTAKLAVQPYADDDLFSLDDEKYAAAVYRRIDAEYAEEHNRLMTAELIKRDNDQRNAMARLDMIFDETNYRFRCADRETAALIARLTANVDVTGPRLRGSGGQQGSA